MKGVFRKTRIFVTAFGCFGEEDMPPDLWERVISAKYRGDGMPDRRSPSSMQAWDDAMAWAEARYLAESPKVTTTT